MEVVRYVQPIQKRTEVLQSFLAFRLEIDYGKRLWPRQSYPPNPPFDDFRDVAYICCRILRLQLRDRRSPPNVLDAQTLQDWFFDPGKVLGIPTDVMEFFLFSLHLAEERNWAKKPLFHADFIRKAHSLALVRLAIDWHYIIPAVIPNGLFEIIRRSYCDVPHQQWFSELLHPRHLVPARRDLTLLPTIMNIGTMGYWPHISRLYCEAYRPSPECRPGFPDSIIVNPRYYNTCINQKTSAEYVFILRPEPNAPGAGDDLRKIYLPGGGWWKNPQGLSQDEELEVFPEPATGPLHLSSLESETPVKSETFVKTET